MGERVLNSLVTGGAGFMGSHLASELIKQGHRVTVLDDLSGGFEDNVPAPAHFVRGSITDVSLVERLFSEGKFDYVFHLAAYAAEGLSHFIKRFNYTNNLIGSVNLINESVRNKVKCFVFTSSIAVYGKAKPPMKEQMVPIPEDPYGIAKLAVEEDLRTTHELFGLNYIIFRPHNVYGEFQNIGDRYRNVVGIFMNQLMDVKPLTVFGDGEQTRAFSYVSDVIPYIARSVHMDEAYNQIFNIGSDDFFSVNRLAQEIMDAMGIQGELRHLPPRNETVNAFADHSKARDVFQIRNSVPLREGLCRMAEWAKRVGSRKSRKFGQIEITEKLPAIWLED